MLCGRCFGAEKRLAGGGGQTSKLVGPDFASLRRLDRGLSIAGIVAKLVLFLLLFLWATKSPIGDAALKGVVIADLFTYLLFSVLDWHFRGLSITAGAIFQLLLILVFTNRHALLDFTEAPEVFAVTLGFFMLVTVFKSAIWAAEHILESGGLKERG